MSFAGTSFPATTSIVIVPGPIVNSNAGPQLGGVYCPLKLKTLLSADAAADASRKSASARRGFLMTSLLAFARRAARGLMASPYGGAEGRPMRGVPHFLGVPGGRDRRNYDRRLVTLV